MDMIAYTYYFIYISISIIYKYKTCDQAEIGNSPIFLFIKLVSDDTRIVAQIAYRILFIVIMSTNQENKNGNTTMAIKLLLWRTTFAGDDGKSDDIYRLIVYEKTFSFSFVLSPSLGDCVFVGIEKKDLIL